MNNEIYTSNRNYNKQFKIFILIGIIILIAFAVAGGVVYKLSNFSFFKKKSKEQVQKSEAYINTTNTNDALSDRIKQIQEEQKLKEERQRLLNEQNKKIAVKQKNELAEKIMQTQQINQQTTTSTIPVVEDTLARKKQGNGLINVNQSSLESLGSLGSLGGNDSITDKIQQGIEGIADKININDKLSGEDYPSGTVNEIMDRDKLLIAGTIISCTLKTKIVTNYPSITLCQVSRDIYSSTGEYILIPKGSIARGEQKSTLTQGDVKVFISWNSIDTTTGKRIVINSMGTDTLGAGGSDAYIDYRFFKRFGNAILLSVIQDTISTSSRMLSTRKAKSITLDGTQDSMSKMAEMALENSINLAPLGYINHGEEVAILVVRDVNFSGHIE